MTDYFILTFIVSGVFMIFLSNGAEAALHNFPRSQIKSVFKTLDKKTSYVTCSSLLHASLLLVKTFGYIFSIAFTAFLLTEWGYRFPEDIWKIFSAVLPVFVLLVYVGQILPSGIAERIPEHFIKRAMPVLKTCYTIFKPVSLLLVIIGRATAPEGSRGVYGGFITEGELMDIIDAGEKGGAIEKEERMMLHSVIEFGDKIVREVMVPRIEMICIEENTEMAEVLNVADEEGFSRIPVYRETVDDITGILYTKDLLKLCQNNCGGNSARIKEILHSPFFVPETKLISELFREFKKKKTHMAVVVDEYGGTAGLITLEDLIEEIVGEIQDEYDEDEEKLIKRIATGVYVIQAKTPVDELNKELDLGLEESDDFDTIGGFIIDKMGKIPRQGESLLIGKMEVTVVEADERSIKLIRARITPQGAEDDEKGFVEE